MRDRDSGGMRRRRRRFDDEDDPYDGFGRYDDDPYVGYGPSDEDDPGVVTHRRAAPSDLDGDPRGPDTGDRWTSWDAAGVLHGPEPRPQWVLTEGAAVDTELGILKTGKEADVYLVERAVPETGRSTLLAAKRYRDAGHRLFHRDAGYLEGRRVRESRQNRAMAKRTAFGKQLIASQWAFAEFVALGRLWELGNQVGGVRVPYPVQLLGTELMLEFIGEPDGTAAPRQAQLRPSGEELADLWRQLMEALAVLARAGLAHGDLSPFNVLIHRGQLVLIDLPQVVDVVSNPQGREFLARDVRVMATWFAARGLPVDRADPLALTGMLLADAGIR